ncbi:MAG: hypothetical protein ACI4D8_08870 [Wujia sp.]
MLKIVGTEDHEIIDEKVIIDDNNRITPFGIKLMLIDIVLDMCLFYCLSRLVKRISKK